MTLSRTDLRKAYAEVTAKFGKPTHGNVYCEEQLFEKVASDLCAFDETHITFQNGAFEVSPNLAITKEYASDHTFIGTVKAEEWYTKEQRKAMHEVAFGYQF